MADLRFTQIVRGDWGAVGKFESLAEAEAMVGQSVEVKTRGGETGTAELGKVVKVIYTVTYRIGATS